MSPDRRQIAALLAAAGLSPSVLAGPALGQITPVDEAPSQIGTQRDRTSRITAPIYINGQGPFRFLVDTGANRSCISEVLADKLGLPEGPRVSLHTVAGQRMRSSVQVSELKVGSRVQKNARVAVLPIVGEEIDGALGVDWLKGQRLVLDFKGHQMEITASRLDTTSDGKVVVPARRKSGQLTIIDADLAGRQISAMIDSGAEISMGNAALRRVIGAQPRNTTVQQIELASLAGEKLVGELLYLSFLRLGGLQLGNVPVVFVEAHVFKLWGLQNVPTLILGMDLLNEFDKVHLDFGRSTVRFDLSDSARIL
jgi:predicted aspartyl protease